MLLQTCGFGRFRAKRLIHKIYVYYIFYHSWSISEEVIIILRRDSSGLNFGGIESKVFLPIITALDIAKAGELETTFSSEKSILDKVRF